MEYNFREIEKKWRRYWAKNEVFKSLDSSDKPKFYVLDMFPYPSGSGLHVGHPLGYIASDIVARYKRLKGYNVLHPMGYDAFGLPAEQYAIQTGQHPAITTEKNISRYREQLDNLGFSFDWSREVRTSDPAFYKWTQWIFTLLFNSWYNHKTDKAEPIESLVAQFASGARELPVGAGSQRWDALNEHQQQELLLTYRLAYISETMVNWCPGLGTVLANEEVIDGMSDRGGFPVERKLMKQWSLRITAYADRLISGLDSIDWPESVKEAQRNWIGKSTGARILFSVDNSNTKIEVFSTRPDTLFGCSFLVLSPEHPLCKELVTPEKKNEVNVYVEKAKNKSDRDRMSEVKQVSGVFTGVYAIHPFTKAKIPVWISEYVLWGYGTGAIMAVPAHDSRDYAFAKHFNLPTIEVVAGGEISKEAYESKTGTLINSDFLNGLQVKEAMQRMIVELEKTNSGKAKVNFRLRDAIFSRQRYWGEPFPVYYKNSMPYVVDVDELPVELPPIDKFLPTETGEPPLARATNWVTKKGFLPDYNTMPGWAGSCWYFLRYMDPHNSEVFVSKEAVNYWKEVDLYIGGAEHTTGHLMYFRFCTKFLYDRGLIPCQEPVKKLINQGMILGRSLLLFQGFYENVVNEVETTIRFCSENNTPDTLVENGKTFRKTGTLHYRIMVQLADEKDRLTLENFNALKKLEVVFRDVDLVNQILWETDTASGIKYIQLRPEVEKMSKSKLNVINPDEIVEQAGADTLRMYEMFLGPLEQHKPWNTNGISGVFNFLKKLWRLYHGGIDATFNVSDKAASPEELKALHKLIRKIEDDIDKFSFNTSVSAMMICVNELIDLKCNKREILEPLAIVISSFAPHIAEELWSELGYKESIVNATFPAWNAEFLIEATIEYPVSFNGKTRCKIKVPSALGPKETEALVLASVEVQKYLAGATPKKVIVVPGRIVNVVV